MSDSLQPGDIVRIQDHFLGLVMHAWDSAMAPVSSRLVSVDYLGDAPQWQFGWHVGVQDAAAFEFMAKGVLPGVLVEDLGMDHPWIMARFQAGIDASFARRWGTSFRDALAKAEVRSGDLFGGAPPGWVATAVARMYADWAFERRTP